MDTMYFKLLTSVAVRWKNKLIYFPESLPRSKPCSPREPVSLDGTADHLPLAAHLSGKTNQNVQQCILRYTTSLGKPTKMYNNVYYGISPLGKPTTWVLLSKCTYMYIVHLFITTRASLVQNVHNNCLLRIETWNSPCLTFTFYSMK